SNLYDEQIRVPLVVAGPGARAGLVVDEPVSTTSIAATVLALAGLAAPADMTGPSVVAAVRGEPFEAPPIFLELARDWRLPRHVVATRVGRHKVIRDLVAGTTEVFDLA